jgi:hypothetical protein
LVGLISRFEDKVPATPALGCWPNAPRDAERAAILAKWTDAVQAAQLAWDAVKSDPEHPQEPEARAAIDALRSTPPDYQEARDHLADGMRKADADYQSALDAARTKHGLVTVSDQSTQ